MDSVVHHIQGSKVAFHVVQDQPFSSTNLQIINYQLPNWTQFARMNIISKQGLLFKYDINSENVIIVKICSNVVELKACALDKKLDVNATFLARTAMCISSSTCLPMLARDWHSASSRRHNWGCWQWDPVGGEKNHSLSIIYEPVVYRLYTSIFQIFIQLFSLINTKTGMTCIFICTKN